MKKRKKNLYSIKEMATIKLYPACISVESCPTFHRYDPQIYSLLFFIYPKSKLQNHKRQENSTHKHTLKLHETN